MHPSSGRRSLPAILLLALLLSTVHVHAQLPHPLDHGSTMLQQGSELERQNKVAEALDLYATVHRSDSVYERVLLRRMACLRYLERNAEVPSICDEGVALDGEKIVYFLDGKAEALIDLERHDEALAVCNEAVRRFPGHYEPYRLRAVVLEKKNDRAAALAALEDNAVRFPLCREAHMGLAILAQREGRISQAALPLFMALIVRWNDQRAAQILGYADQLLDGKLDKDPKGYDITKGDDFAELDLLLANKVGMDRGYKVKPDLPYAFVRQGHFLLHTLKDHPAGDGFWTTYYVPFFRKVIDRKLFLGCMTHCLSNSGEPRITASISKYKKEVEAFRQALLPLLEECFATFPDSIGNELRPVRHHYNDDGDLFAMGEGNLTDGSQTGPWQLYHATGGLAARIPFGADHRKNGTALNYYDNGMPLRSQEWKNGVEEGLFLSWHRNGALKDSIGVVGGKGNGLFAQYASSGALDMRKTLDHGDITGPATVFHACGTPSAAVKLIKDKIDGEGTWHYPDGRISFTGTYKEGLRNGTCVSYYANGNKESSYTYVNDLHEGVCTDWYSNGAKKSEGTYHAGKPTGQRTTWYITGGVDTEQTFDDQGREQLHKGYTEEGQLFTEMGSARGLLMRYRYYDRTGKVLGEGKRAKGRFQLEGFTPDGAKRMRGSYLDEGAKEGAWTWWYPDGTVRSEENLKNGIADGTQREYNTNGKLRTQYDYIPEKGNTGPFTSYAADGTIAAKGWLENGQLNGDRFAFLPDGKLIAHEHYVNGKLEGWQVAYDRDGVLLTERLVVDGTPRKTIHYDTTGKEYERIGEMPGPVTLELIYPDSRPYASLHYMNNTLHGPGIWYYPDGSKAVEGNYLNGERHGTWTYWHPNGQMSTQNTYDLGQLTGTSRAWDIAGTLTNEETYENGLSTSEKAYHPNGKLAIDRPKRAGMMHGAAKSYNTTGDLQLIRYYVNDRLVGYSYNGADGQPVDTIPLEAGLAQLRPKYANGKPSREMDLRNGEIDGPYREFHSDGTLMEEDTYVAGGRQGLCKEFHVNGKPASVCSWVNGERHGEELEYWENGLLRDRCMWVYGQRHGERTLYDKAGKPSLILTYRSGDLRSMRKP